jgi:phage gp36-like protein
MAYSTLDDIRKLLPEEELIALTDDEGLGSVNLSRVDEAVSQADAEVDSYCGTRYSVPVSPAPALLKKLSVDIAIHALYSRTVQSMPEVRSERYRAAIRQLESIARGTLTLGVQEAEAAEDGGAETNKATDDAVFTRKGMEGF